MTSKALEAAIVFAAKDTGRIGVAHMAVTQAVRDSMLAQIEELTIEKIRATLEFDGLNEMVLGIIRAYAENVTDESVRAAILKGIE